MILPLLRSHQGVSRAGGGELALRARQEVCGRFQECGYPFFNRARTTFWKLLTVYRQRKLRLAKRQK
jgi:hypothetical protein